MESPVAPGSGRRLTVLVRPEQIEVHPGRGRPWGPRAGDQHRLLRSRRCRARLPRDGRGATPVVARVLGGLRLPPALRSPSPCAGRREHGPTSCRSRPLDVRPVQRVRAHRSNRGAHPGRVYGGVAGLDPQRGRAQLRARLASPVISTRAASWRPDPNRMCSPGSPPTTTRGPAPAVLLVGPVRPIRWWLAHAWPSPRPHPCHSSLVKSGSSGRTLPRRLGPPDVLDVDEEFDRVHGPVEGPEEQRGTGADGRHQFLPGRAVRLRVLTASVWPARGGRDHSPATVGSPFAHDQMGGEISVVHPSHRVGSSGPSSTSRSQSSARSDWA